MAREFVFGYWPGGMEHKMAETQDISSQIWTGSRLVLDFLIEMFSFLVRQAVVMSGEVTGAVFLRQL